MIRAAAFLVLAGLLVPAPATAAVRHPAHHDFRQFTTGHDWRAGTMHGVRPAAGSLSITTPAGRLHVGGRGWDQGWWTSGWITPKHGFTLLNPSWNARTPAGTWIRVNVRVRSHDARSTWQNLGRWTTGSAVTRSSAGAQADALSTVSVDTLVARPGVTLSAYKLQVHLVRRHGSTASPTLRSVHAVASQPASSLAPVSRRLLPARTLPVPEYSQMIHRGEYPAYGGGGEAWCSPTSLAMILGYYGALPGRSAYAWVNRRYRDRFVDEVARRVFDHAYDGTGNWPFNTAYAATGVLNAVVTRLSSLRGAERFIANGIPLEASIAFGRGQLTGAPISSTPGHLVVIVGFTRNGDVVVNDPAAPTDATVRRTYDRAQFEAAWQRTSHGLVYAMRTRGHPWPTGF